MVFNTTSAEVLDRALAKSTHHAVIRQLLYAILAGILAAGVWFLGFDQILRLSGFFLGFVTFLLVLVFIPGIGQCLNGAHRWLGIGSYSFQPSELAKYLIPLYYISYVTSDKTTLVLKDFLKLLLKLAVPMGLILIEPDNGTVAIILSSLLVLFSAHQNPLGLLGIASACYSWSQESPSLPRCPMSRPDPDLSSS